MFEEAFVAVSVLIFLHAASLFQSVHKTAFVFCAVGKNQSTLAVEFIIFPFTFVGVADVPFVNAIAITLIIFPLSVVYGLEQGQNLNILLNERVRVATSSQGIVYEEYGKGMVTEEYNKLTTPVGGEYSLVLSDGTKVFLNADSELKYPVEFSDGKRIVDLKGEAYFEVHKDSLRPFIVRMNGAEVTVLGTSFNVNTYEDDGQIYTTLVNGSVRVSSVKNGQAEVLKPGMQSVMDVQSGQLTVREVDVEPYVAWREGRFVFRAMTLDLIMRQLQRWYDFEVFYQNPELKDYEFRGVIKRDMDLDKVLSVIKVTTNVDFEVKGKVITIIKR